MNIEKHITRLTKIGLWFPIIFAHALSRYILTIVIRPIEKNVNTKVNMILNGNDYLTVTS